MDHKIDNTPKEFLEVLTKVKTSSDFSQNHDSIGDPGMGCPLIQESEVIVDNDLDKTGDPGIGTPPICESSTIIE